MPFDFDRFCEGLKRAKFTNVYRSDEKALKENIPRLQNAWKAGNGADVKRYAKIISEKIKTGSVDPTIKSKLQEIQTGKEKPPRLGRIPDARGLHPTTSTTDLSNKTDSTKLSDDQPEQESLAIIRQKRNEKELETTKVKLSELAKDVDNFYGLVFATKDKEKLPQAGISEHTIDQIRAQISKIKDEVNKREKRCKEEHVDELKQIYKDIMKTDFKQNSMKSIEEQMTLEFLAEIDRSKTEATKQLYKDIKGHEFALESNRGEQKTNKSKAATKQVDPVPEITKELKEDINRVNLLKPKLQTMFTELTGKDLMTGNVTQQGKAPQGKADLNLIEDILINDMTNQLKEYNASKKFEFISELYKEIKGREFSKRAPASKSKNKDKGNKSNNDHETMIQDIKKELKEDLDRLKAMGPKLEYMFNGITGKEYIPKSDSKPGKKKTEMDEIEILRDMDNQLRNFTEGITKDMLKKDDVRNDLCKLYEEVTGEKTNMERDATKKKNNKSNSSENNGFDFETMVKDISEGIKRTISKLERSRDELEKDVRDLHNAVIRHKHTVQQRQDACTMPMQYVLKDIEESLNQKEAYFGIEDVNEMLGTMFNEVFGKPTDLRKDDSTQRSDSRKEIKHIEQAFRSMSGRMKQCLENQKIAFTKDLYKEIKGQEFSPRQSSARSGKDGKGNTSDSHCVTPTEGIRKVLKEDLDRLKEVIPELRKMFQTITGGEYVPYRDNQEYKTRGLNELEMVQDMTLQMKGYFEKALRRRIDPSDVGTEAKRLYIITTGDKKGPKASISDSDFRTFFDDFGSELMEAVEKKESTLLAECEDVMRNMYASLIGKAYNEQENGPPSLKSLTKIIHRTTDEMMQIKSVENKKMTQQQHELSLCKLKLTETESHLKKAIQDREEYLNRLSKVAGARLTHDNPDIADLSDQNRPTKLAEKYSELYDNNWTDAFDIIARNNTEQETIAILVNVLQEAYSYSMGTSEKQTVLLKSTLLKPSKIISLIECNDRAGANSIMSMEKVSKTEFEGMSVEVMKLLQDIRKSSWKDSFMDLSEGFHPEIVAKYRKNEHVSQYVQECLELTWLMVLQSPPLVLDDSVAKKGSFDKNKYREYTKSGKKYDYLVWPALLIQKGGAILQKGVAQGLK